MDGRNTSILYILCQYCIISFSIISFSIISFSIITFSIISFCFSSNTKAKSLIQCANAYCVQRAIVDMQARSTNDNPHPKIIHVMYIHSFIMQCVK